MDRRLKPIFPAMAFSGCCIAGIWLLAGRLTDNIAAGLLRNIFAIPGAAQQLSPYGISAEMSLRLLPSYPAMRQSLFWWLMGICAGICILFSGMTIYVYCHLSRRMRTLAQECRNSAPPGTIFISRCRALQMLSDNIQRMTDRMLSLSRHLHREKQFLQEFLTDFSHQIKNALANVRLDSDMLAELPLIPAQRSSVTAELSTNLDAMESLVLAALQLAKLNADAVLYEKQCLSLAETCRLALQRTMPMLRERQIAAMPDLQDTLFLHDREWFCEAVQNLLSNAATHAECSEIRIQTEILPSAIRLRIADNGKGIPQAEIPTLFTRFGHRHSGTDTNTGIGLAIARKIMEAHGGTITVFSNGQGTIFEILLLRSQNAHNSATVFS